MDFGDSTLYTKCTRTQAAKLKVCLLLTMRALHSRSVTVLGFGIFSFLARVGVGVQGQSVGHGATQTALLGSLLHAK